MAEKWLTKAEQRVLGALPERVFSLGEAHEVLDGDKRYLSEVLSRLAAKGRLLRLKRGLFKIPSADAELEAGLGFGGAGSYLGFASALSLHNMIDERLSAVFVASRSRRLRRIVRGTEYRVVPLDRACVGAVELRRLRVSSRAKTVFDCLLKPALCGGLGVLAGVLRENEFSREEWRGLLNYAQEFGSDALKQRLGFAAERYAKPPEFFLRELERDVGKTVAFWNPRQRRGVYDARWRVVARV